jgi:hypothetical protein
MVTEAADVPWELAALLFKAVVGLKVGSISDVVKADPKAEPAMLLTIERTEVAKVTVESPMMPVSSLKTEP